MRLLAIALFALVASCGGEPASAPDMATRDIPLFTMGCMSGDQDGNETDIDCGGSCTPCAAGKMCNVAADCDSGVCFNRVCSAATCNDSVTNGTETDIDCGGGSCLNKCADGKHCKDGVDCQSGGCANNVCAPSLCSNMQQDGMETDIDCGGPMCMACADGRKCKDATDCVGLMCLNNVCGGAGGGCMNMMKDGTETDVDCGGGMCSRCSLGKVCAGNLDCQSTNCSNAICCAPGFANCGGAKNCATVVSADDRNCGACGNVCPMNLPACLGGRCKAKPSVLVIHAEGQGQDLKRAEDVQQKLLATGSFSMVDLFDGRTGTPMVGQLQTYDVLLVYSDYAWADPIALGDNLATYFDGGGQIVLTQVSLSTQPVGGRFGDPVNGYFFLMPAKPTDNTKDSLGAIVEPMSPLVKDVNALMADTALRGTGAVINGGVVVAEWKGKRPLIIRGSVKGRNRVDLNFFPPSFDVQSNLWQGDGAALLRNALLYR